MASQVMTATPQLDSVLTCPECGHAKRERMPTDACQFFYECERCKTVMRPKAGDCCVFCSYGSVQCPPVQLAGLLRLRRLTAGPMPLLP